MAVIETTGCDARLVAGSRETRWVWFPPGHIMREREDITADGWIWERKR